MYERKPASPGGVVLPQVARRHPALAGVKRVFGHGGERFTVNNPRINEFVLGLQCFLNYQSISTVF